MKHYIQQQNNTAYFSGKVTKTADTIMYLRSIGTHVIILQLSLRVIQSLHLGRPFCQHVIEA